MKIVPAVLSDNLDDYSSAYRLFEVMPENDKVHIDIMDGVFVKTTSPDFESILKIPTKLKKQVHLMVQDPIPYIEICAKHGVKEVILHLGTNYGEIDDLMKYGMEIFIGINPENKTIEFTDLISRVTGFLIMTVHPGLQGQPFLPKELLKVNYLRDRGFIGRVVVDGSVNKDTLPEVKTHKIDEAVVGSAIIKQIDPIEAYTGLNNLLNS